MPVVVYRCDRCGTTLQLCRKRKKRNRYLACPKCSITEAPMPRPSGNTSVLSGLHLSGFPGSGIVIHGGDYLVQDVVSTDNDGDGMRVAASNITVSRSMFAKNGRYGLAASDTAGEVSDTLFDRNVEGNVRAEASRLRFKRDRFIT